MREFIFLCANEFPVYLLCKQNTIVLKSPLTGRPHLHLLPGPRAPVSYDPVHTVSGHNLRSPFHSRPDQSRAPGPSVQEDQSGSHFPDDIIPARAKSLFGGVFFHALLLFPFLDPGTNPSHVCFPNMVTQTACLAD